MSTVKRKVVLDTNVWLDYSDPDRAGFPEAMALLDKMLLAIESVDLYYLSANMKDVYYLFLRDRKSRMRAEGREVTPEGARAMNEIAWASIAHIEDIATPLPLDARTLWMAPKLRDYNPDFEDCLLLAACELFDIDLLVTSDEQLLRHAPCNAMAPKEAATYLEVVTSR